MFTIWKDELFKMASKKIIWLGLFLLALFLSWRLFAERKNYSVTIDGHNFYGQEAIDRDRTLTAGYAGIFTEQSVQNIYEDFGFYYHDIEKDEYIGNFCNNFITRRMTNYNMVDEPSYENVSFLEGEAWEQNVAPLLNGTFVFDYTHGWDDLKEVYSMITVMAMFILLIILISPVFSEEYSLKTANILLTTKRGRRSGIWLKAAAALFLVIIIYSVFTAYLWLIYGIVYGTQGLNASPVFIGITHVGYYPATVLGFFLFSFALGLAGLVLLTSITLLISAVCRNAFFAVILSLAVFFVPYAWMNALSWMLAPLIGRSLVNAVSHVMISMPFYLPVNWGFALTVRQIAAHLGIAFVAGVCCMGGMYWCYCNYQG